MHRDPTAEKFDRLDLSLRANAADGGVSDAFGDVFAAGAGGLGD